MVQTIKTEHPITMFGTIPVGSTMLGVGDFTANGIDEILFSNRGTLFTLGQSGTRAVQTTLGTIVAGESFVGVGTYNPGENDVLIESNMGAISYITVQNGTLSNPGGTSIASVQLGQIFIATLNYDAGFWGPPQGPFTGPYQPNFISENINTGQYFYNGSVVAPIPTGFTVVPNSAGNYLNTDISSLLIENHSGTVSAIAAVIGSDHVVGTAVVVPLGTLASGQSIVAVSDWNIDGSSNVLLEQGTALIEWTVNRGSVVAVTNLGDISAGFSVVGMGNLSGNGAADVVLANASGTIAAISGSIPFTPSKTLLTAQTPVVIQSYSYGANAASGSQLYSTVPLPSQGNRLLTIGTPSYATSENFLVGAQSESSWENSVAVADEIGQYCNANGIVVQVETNMGGGISTISAPQVEQWLYPMIAAGIPVAYVDCNQEIEDNYIIVNGRSVQVKALSEEAFIYNETTIEQQFTVWAQNLLANFAIIHAAYPNAVFGEWDQIGTWDNVAQTSSPSNAVGSGEGSVLTLWLQTINTLAASEHLPGISYIIADETYSPNYGILAGGALGVSDVGQAQTTSDVTSNVGALIRMVGSLGVKVILQDQVNVEDLNGLQAAAREELEISQQASLGAVAFQLDPSFSTLPISDAVNEPGATYNTLALLSGITPLYAEGEITATGPVVLTLRSQIVLTPGTVVPLGGLTLTATAADQHNKLAVVLIDQTGTLSVSVGGSTAAVSGNGTNDVVLDGTPEQIAASLASLKIEETVSGPDQVDVEVFGTSGRIGGGTITVLSSRGSLSFLPETGGASPEIWTSARATLTGGIIHTETLAWNTSAGLSTSVVGGPIALPLYQIMVQQPLLEVNPGGGVETLGAPESIPVIIAQSVLDFDLNTGKLQTRMDTIAPVPLNAISTYPTADGTYYFANGGTAVTQYDTGDNPDWPGSVGILYAQGGTTSLGAALVASFNGTTLTVSDGSVNPMIVGSIQTIYGNVGGQSKVVEVRYMGGPSNPYDEIDEVFDPLASKPTLWQLINTVGIPASMVGANGAPLPVPSATTIVEYNTGDNPNWIAGDSAAEVARTFENGNLFSEVKIASNGSVSAGKYVTWIGEAEILNNYTLATPTVTSAVLVTKPKAGFSGLTISGTGIAGDWINATVSNNFMGGTQIGSNGQWSLSLSGVTKPAQVTIVQYDLAGDSSAPVGVPPAIAGSGITTAVVIASANGTTLAQAANEYEFNPSGGGPFLRYQNNPVTVGQFGAGVAPVGVVKTASGYEVAWSLDGGQFIVWNTDSNGNYTSCATAIVPGSSLVLQQLETSFHQDLNNDGTMGAPTVTIEALGSTTLVQIGNQYAMRDSGGSGPTVQFQSTPVTTGQFGTWAPIGAEAITGGYEVAWKDASSGQFIVWNTDANGNYTANATAIVSGQSFTLEGLEPTFGADLNGDHRLSAVLVTSPGSGNVLNLAAQTQATTINLGSNIASVHAGLNAPSLSFIGTPDAITLGSTADIIEYALQPSSGIEEVAGFILGTDELNIDLMGMTSNSLLAFDTKVNGNHAIALASSSDLLHGIVLTNVTGGLTAASLLTSHTTFIGGHALIS